MIRDGLALCAAACWLAACGGAAARLAVEDTTDLLAAATADDEPPPPPDPPGGIRRTALDELLAAGPGAFLALVETAPERRNGRFAGFRITGFPEGPPRNIDLRVDDVVRRVGGREIERPEQYLDAFRALAGADELRFEILRDGEAMIVICPVVD